MKYTLYGLIALVATFMQKEKSIEPVVTNFEECVAAGNAVMESYPRQCRHGEQLFVEEVEIHE